MEIRRDGCAEHRQCRVAVGAVVEVTEDLVVGTIFFHDVDDVLDPLVQEVHHPLVARNRLRGVKVVLRNPSCQPRQVGPAGHRGADK